MCSVCDKNDPFGFESLDHEPASRGPVVQEEATTPSGERFACEHCGGSGRWRGGINRNGDKECFACRGTGFFKTSRAQRIKAKMQRESRKQRLLEESRDVNAGHEDGELLNWISRNTSWNQFCASLIEQHHAGRVWTERQVAAVKRMRDKTEATRAAKAKARKASGTQVGDVSRIREMFQSARDAGLIQIGIAGARLLRDEDGKPILDEDGRPQALEAFDLKPARLPKTNIWVRVEGTFCGGIDENGMFRPNRDAPAWLARELEILAADPEAESRLMGKATGTCICCRRTLTNPASIEAGIGPKCAMKWGL